MLRKKKNDAHAKRGSIISLFFISLLFTAFFGALPVYAQTIIPKPPPSMNYTTCEAYLIDFTEADTKTNLKDKANRDQTLACAVITGRIRLFMLPYFLVYLIEVIVGFAGVLCVLFIVIGGFQYAMSGISDEKEKGKKTVMNAIFGLVIVTLSWIIINVIQIAISS
ncbi:hypothetical protein HYV56_01985 [Candidatus Peregrinibacteria bacterium]|nr:hypothetical protein [Candidatus Peregrinibacteria bacterium]